MSQGFSDPAGNLVHLGLRDSSQVADFGAGSGEYVFAAARIVRSGVVHAVDIQKDLLEKIKREAKEKKLENVEIIWGDLDSVGGSKLKDASMDAVIISNLLFQAENRGAVVAEANRVLKPSGKVLVVDWSGSFGNIGPQAGSVITKDAAQKLFVDKNFEILESFDAGDHHYGFVAKKK